MKMNLKADFYTIGELVLENHWTTSNHIKRRRINPCLCQQHCQKLFSHFLCAAHSSQTSLP